MEKSVENYALVTRCIVTFPQKNVTWNLPIIQKDPSFGALK